MQSRNLCFLKRDNASGSHSKMFIFRICVSTPFRACGGADKGVYTQANWSGAGCVKLSERNILVHHIMFRRGEHTATSNLSLQRVSLFIVAPIKWLPQNNSQGA